MGLKTIPLGKACCLKAGITTSADMIHEQSNEFSVPCYGGNGIRGYVESATQCGCYPIIGRQGALCGNVQLATGKFHATEHAVLVTPLIETNVVWLFYLLHLHARTLGTTINETVQTAGVESILAIIYTVANGKDRVYFGPAAR